MVQFRHIVVGARLNDGTGAGLDRANLTGRKQATFFKPGVRDITPDFLAWQLNHRQAQQCSAASCNVSQNQIRNAFDGSKRVALSEANSRKIVETCQARAEVDKYAHRIIEHEQQGERRAVYGTQQLETVSSRLTAEFGKGFNVRNLRNEFSWTHYRVLLRVNKPEAREWYMHEAALQNWSSRALERQIGTLYYERLLSGQDKAPVEGEARAKTAPLADDPRD